jgi:hypothetical protein
MGRPPARLAAQPRQLSRPERARTALAYLSRVMRPVTCQALARVVGVAYHAMQSAVDQNYDPWFTCRGGVVWISEAGWRERLAGHKDLR